MTETINDSATALHQIPMRLDFEPRTNADASIVAQALAIVRSRMIAPGADALSSPQATRDYLTLQLAGIEYEIFACVYLDTRNRVIAFEKLFRGTIDGAAVYPREVVKAALHYNAAAVIFAHNHPSGIAEPSRADRDITKRLTDALALVDIRVLDHVIVAHDIVSLAERGLI